MPDDVEIMGDKQVGELKLLLEILEEVEHLGLDGDVEGRDGLDAAAVDRLEVDDPQLKQVWGGVMFRIRLTERSPSARGRREFRITP